MSIARQASEITLPAADKRWPTVYAFLCSHFARINPETWRERILADKVHWFNGETITLQTPFLPGKRLCYYREVATEPAIPFAHKILYQDQHILVADKPHFLPVTPGGEYVNECLLARLKCDTGIDDMVPVHRLDRDTAGLVLFSINAASRAAYYQLFQQAKITKHYQAVALLNAKAQHCALPKQWHVANRIEKSQPRFINAIVPGPVNAVSDISLVARQDNLGLFALMPHSGKTHQLRLHMLSLGMPILHDNYYPTLKPKQAPDFTKPLQLLAQQLCFTDPLHHTKREFKSRYCLSLPIT
ncbi:MAG: pseudouridine synthase [Chromatiaceae bacterium]|nr:pseudouridine synthase [Chromatiaceae bacterium]